MKTYDSWLKRNFKALVTILLTVIFCLLIWLTVLLFQQTV
jgi:hypothetical protein